MPGVLEEHREGLCGWSRVKGRGGRREGGEGMGQVLQGIVGHQEDVGFDPRKVGAMESCRQRRDGA